MYEDRSAVKQNPIKVRVCDYLESRVIDMARRKRQQKAVLAREAIEIGLEIMEREYQQEQLLEGPQKDHLCA